MTLREHVILSNFAKLGMIIQIFGQICADIDGVISYPDKANCMRLLGRA